MSVFETLMKKIKSVLSETNYQFKETLTYETVLKFSTKEPKYHTHNLIKEFIDERYKNLTLFCKTMCHQDELYTDRYIDTIEEYLEVFKDRNEQ